MTRQANTLAEKAIECVATLGPAGYADTAPGTWGSVAAVLAAPWFFLPLPLVWRMVLLAAVFAVGVAVSGWMADRTGRKDPKEVVVDELAGQWTAMLLVPQGDLFQALVALALFRLFDITKPGLIAMAEQPGNGWGVMLDDMAAGAVALGIMFVLF